MDASGYQLFRLWAGICSIGVNLGLIWAAYMASHWLPGLNSVTDLLLLPLWALGIALFMILAFLPFEILTGYAGEAAFSRGQQSFREWFRDWRRSQWLVVLGLVVGICLFGWGGSLSLPWQLTAVLAVCLVIAGFIMTLSFWIRMLGGMPSEQDPELEEDINQELLKHGASPLNLHILDDGDEEGVNGTILPFQSDTLLINQSCGEELHAEELAAMALREQWFHQKGQSTLCLMIVIGWMAAGVLLALILPTAWLGASSALQLGLGGAAIFTTWCFLALLIWPPLNNRMMLQADLYLAEKIGMDETVMLLNKIQTLNETDFDISESKEQIFHPIPSLRKRLEYLQSQAEAEPENQLT
ncbi:MAG: hypothetical protein AAF571_09040 [Verrucomicrobiota bacterium]